MNIMADNPQERELIRQIANRICNQNPDLDKLTINMDLNACHTNGCELDLEKMLNGSEADLMHDIWGINQNICRETGTLKNCFLPRFHLPNDK